LIKNETSIEQCRRLIEASLQWGDPSSWTNEDFEELSEKIYAVTSVRLSVSTLKRIWGKVRYDSSPTAATLNALARFAGFDNWRTFVARHGGVYTEEETVIDHMVPVDMSSGSPVPMMGVGKRSMKRRRIRTGLVIVVTAAIIGLLSLFGSRLKQTPASGASDLRFEAKQTSDDLPNSVVFQYNARKLYPEKLMIQQSWDSTRREEVPTDSREHTSLYYYPGFFIARLIADGQTLKKTEVFIKTKGWKGIIQRDPLPLYLKDAEIKTPGSLEITAATLQQKTGAAVFNDVWTDFTNVREFKGLDSADFTMAVTLRNSSSREQAPCRRINIYILGTQSAIIIPLADKGCISEMRLLTGDGWISGKENDLSGLGCDFNSFQHLECQVKDQRLKILLHNKLILDTSEHQTIGAIIGIRIGFEGAGEMRDIRLDGHGMPIYQESF